MGGPAPPSPLAHMRHRHLSACPTEWAHANSGETERGLSLLLLLLLIFLFLRFYSTPLSFFSGCSFPSRCEVLSETVLPSCVLLPERALVTAVPSSPTGFQGVSGFFFPGGGSGDACSGVPAQVPSCLSLTQHSRSSLTAASLRSPPLSAGDTPL